MLALLKQMRSVDSSVGWRMLAFLMGDIADQDAADTKPLPSIVSERERAIVQPYIQLLQMSSPRSAEELLVEDLKVMT